MNHYSLRLLKWGKYRWLPVVPHEAVAEVSKIGIGQGGMSWCCDVGTINGWSESRFLVSRSSWRNGAMCPSALSDLPVLPDLSDLNLVIYFFYLSLSIWLMNMQAAILQDFLKSEICRAENAILRDFLQKWKLQSWKRGKSMRLLQKMEIVELKTKQFCETYFIFLNVDCRPCGSVLSRFVTFWCWVLKVLRLPRKSDAESSKDSEVLHLPRNMICKI